MFLVYGGDEELVVKGYVDASFDIDLDDSKSQTGYVYILNGGAVSVRERSNFKQNPTHTQDHVMHSNEGRVWSTYPTQTDCGSDDTM